MNNIDPLQDQIDEQAASWVARLGARPLPPPEQQRLDAWLAADTAHLHAFQAAQRAWTIMGELTPQLVSTPVQKTWRARIAAAACVLIVGAGVVLGLDISPENLQADYHTPKGKLQQIELSDGSKINLGPASAISLDYSDQQRRVRLLSGAAYFEVAPMTVTETRPFVVQAEGGQVRALGTEFAVQQLAKSMEVAVTEHSVEVSLAAAPDKRVVSEGEQLRYGDKHLGEVSRTNPERIAAWRRERLIFDQLPLEDVATILSRYASKRILVTDSTLAQRRVSGVFITDNPDLVLETIATELQLRITRIPPFVTLLHP